MKPQPINGRIATIQPINLGSAGAMPTEYRCPICRLPIGDAEDRASFADYPRAIVHADCIDEMGADRAAEICGHEQSLYDSI